MYRGLRTPPLKGKRLLTLPLSARANALILQSSPTHRLPMCGAPYDAAAGTIVAKHTCCLIGDELSSPVRNSGGD